MYHPLEGEACQCLELVQIRTAEDIEHGLVRVDQLLRFGGFIDEQAPRHMSADLFNNGKSSLRQFKCFPCHIQPSNGSYAKKLFYAGL